MLLKSSVLVVVAIWLGYEHAWLLSFVSLMALTPGRTGLLLAISLAVLCLLTGHPWPGIILGALIGWNLGGSYVIERVLSARLRHEDAPSLRQPAPTRTSTPNTTMTAFMAYCRGYLRDFRSMSPGDAQLLVLDPDLGPPMDQAKARWAMATVEAGLDLDQVLEDKMYRAPIMEPIDSVLDQFAARFGSRKAAILQYLEKIGHPLARS
jgi:hypothetical protein